MAVRSVSQESSMGLSEPVIVPFPETGGIGDAPSFLPAATNL
jgi:hypothetical protein